MKALVIDAEYVLRNYYSGVLTGLGMGVVNVNDADTGIRMLRQDPAFDLIVFGIPMQGTSAWEALSVLKAIKPDMKVIVSSSFFTAESERKLTEMGIDVILKKPFPLLNFRSAVSGLFGL